MLFLVLALRFYLLPAVVNLGYLLTQRRTQNQIQPKLQILTGILTNINPEEEILPTTLTIKIQNERCHSFSIHFLRMAIHLIKSNTLSHLMTPWRILPLYFATVKQRDWVFAQIFHRFGMISFIHIYQKKLFVWSRYLQKLHKTPIYRKSVWTLGCALAYNAEIFDIHHDFSIAHGPRIHPTSIPIDVLIDCSDFYRAGNCRANGWVVNLWIKEPTNETFPGCQYLGIIRNQTVGIV